MSGYKMYFKKFIAINYPAEHLQILSELENNYQSIAVDTDFANTSQNPVDRRLDFSGYFLALIKTLESRGESYPKIRSLCLQITTAYVQPRTPVHAFFRRLLPRLTNTWPGQRLISAFGRKVGSKSHPDGFVVNVITDQSETHGLGYGFDILECGICKLFQKHNFSQYASILCEVDELTSGLAGLQLIRTGTIANGAAKCDFRFRKMH
ncbi:MAG: L-2-amino-thiazoline-4-carboxylic acid hydrolase [Saprospiraceae bacterium]|nr:L-2-amino-thiazoline-4-carboxylic acid hydrolase [Saprospiraceae bacterium]MBX7175878.1 L-2-amino-thiazoline-4-carboxylic acid hydrolase [Saprospiraceae bacterium]HMW40467.1 L-2-amino-thiazoline-4-carboxylic acid hydrolase [Saprospiraceae bacterium]HMX88859.1 L-2-amino-thiazoline-4-carboxylic acid hydrolase [Saprospiraceae bacterium]HMZ41012.1 L-2-amino-thiazoline-4-carboxylic acid hydrolase [Saprospiraceae bacterium]